MEINFNECIFCMWGVHFHKCIARMQAQIKSHPWIEKRSTPGLTCARRHDLKINLKCLFLTLTLRVHWWSCVLCARCVRVLTWILIPGLNPGSASFLSAGSYHSAPLLAPCVFSALEQIKCCMLRCQQILQTLMCRWTHKYARKHTHTHWCTWAACALESWHSDV